MKKVLAMLVILAVLLSLGVTTMAAEAQSLDEIFENATTFLDMYYELNSSYMATKVNQQLYPWEEMEANNFEPKVMGAAEVEAALYKYFAPTDAQLEDFRFYLSYDAAAGTYILPPWGGFGGNLPPRQYLGYTTDGSTYQIYWQQVNYAFLEAVLPDDVDSFAYAESLGWPYEIEYGGFVYENGPEGYYRIEGLMPFGNVYTAEYDGEAVRLLSAGTFDESTFPVLQSLPEEGGIQLEVEESFAPGTKVTVAWSVSEDVKPKVEQAMAQVATQYKTISIEAKLAGETVQPNGKVTVQLEIPAEFSTDVTVYYLNESTGKLEALETTVDAATRVATVELEHFSIYLMADNATKPSSGEPTQPTQPNEPTQPGQQSTTGAQSGTQPTQAGTTGNSEAENSGDIGIWIAGAAIAAAVVLLLIGFLLYRKSGRK